MSEEQKEYEVMQLVNLMDKMQRQVSHWGCGARAAADRGQDHEKE